MSMTEDTSRHNIGKRTKIVHTQINCNVPKNTVVHAKTQYIQVQMLPTLPNMHECKQQYVHVLSEIKNLK